MNKLNCGIKVYWIAGLTQLIGFTSAAVYFPSVVIPMFAGAFLIWFSLQVEILYQYWKYPAKIVEFQNRPRDWTDQYDIITNESDCGWENVYQEEKEREEWDEECFGNYATDPIHDEPILGGGIDQYGNNIVIDDEDDDDIIQPDLVTAEEIIENYKKIGEEYSRLYKEYLAKELERTGLSEQEYFQACFGDDVGRKL